MRQWKLIAGVIIVFALGILAGSLGTRLLYKYRVIRPARMEPSERKELILKKYSKALALSAEQVAVRDPFDILQLEVSHQAAGEGHRADQP